jgi:hypothetical protein
MELIGDESVPAMPLADSEVNHLRRLLAWLRVEYTLDEDMQRGFLLGAHECVARGFASSDQASAIVQQKAEQINHVPAYVRQSVKMLTKAIRKHDSASGVVEQE